jgi:hypothetical protein
LPEWIDAILTRGLAKAAADRYQTAAEFRLALERGLAGALTHTPRTASVDDNAETIGPMVTPTALRRVPEATAPPPPAPATSPPSGTARTETSVTLRAPHLAVAGVLLVLLVVAVGLLAFAALRRPIAPVAAPIETAIEPAAAEATASPSSTPEPPTNEPAPSDLAAAAAQAQTPAPVPAPSGPSTASGSAKPAQTPGAPPPPATAGASTSKPSAAAAGTATPAAAQSGRGQTPATAPATSATSTAPPPSQPTPADAASRGAAASSAGGTASAGTTNSLAESFGDIKTLVADGTKSRELDALLLLEPERLVVRNRDNGSILQATPYQSIAAATYTRSKQPRWQEAESVAPIPKNFSGSGFFLKSSRHWLTLQSKTEFVILRLEDKNFRMVLASLEARTGLKVQQPVSRD